MEMIGSVIAIAAAVCLMVIITAATVSIVAFVYHQLAGRK